MSDFAFDAAAAVKPLTFTFKPYVELEGTVPEPDQDRLDRFRRTVVDLSGQVFDDDGKFDEQKVKKLIDDAGGKEAFDHKSYDQVLDCYADACGGSPTREQLDTLPATIRTAFFQWVWRSFTDPTSRTPGTTP